MPELEINLDALAHNLRLVQRQEQAWGFRFLPVLKMVATHPDIVGFLRAQGYARHGIADMTEHLLYGQEPPARPGRVLSTRAPRTERTTSSACSNAAPSPVRRPSGPWMQPPVPRACIMRPSSWWI